MVHLNHSTASWSVVHHLGPPRPYRLLTSPGGHRCLRRRPFGLLGYAPRHLPCSPLIFDRRYHDFLWLFAHNTPPSSLGVPVTSKIKSCCFHISRDVIVTRASMPTDDDDLLLELAWLILMISFSRDVKPGAIKAEGTLMVAVTVWHLLLIRGCLFANFRMVIEGSCLSWKSLNASSIDWRRKADKAFTGN